MDDDRTRCMSEAPTVLVVCGSRREPSRTRELARVAAEVGIEMGLSVRMLDLREYPMELFDGREPDAYDEVTTEAISMVLDAEIYLVASPVYFGGMSGALKNLVDHIPYESFAETSRAAGILATGRDARHQFVIERQLRSTLVYLGVDVATTSVFATEEDFDRFTLENPSVTTYIESTIEEAVSLQNV